jgi:hypothetical protein
MATCAFSCHGICRKKQIHRGMPGKKRTSPPEACIYIMCSYGLGSKPISTLCKAATACLPAHSAQFLCCCKQLSSVSLFLPPCFVTFQAGRFGHSWTPPSSATTHSHALKQILLCRLSFKEVLHKPAFKDAFTASSSTVVFVQSLSQPHSSK